VRKIYFGFFGVLTVATLLLVGCPGKNNPAAPATPTPVPYSSGAVTVVNSGINQPYGIAFDRFSGSGDIWFVGNSNPGTIYGYTAAGAAVTSEYYYFSSATPYDFPNQISADPNGYLYLSDTGNSQIEVLSPAGAYIGVAISGLINPEDALVNAAGTTLYVIEDTTPNVTFLTYSIAGAGYPKSYLSTSNSFPTSGAFDPSRATCLAFDPNGNVYVGDFNNADILKYGPTGASPVTFVPPSSSKIPWGFAFDSSGNLFVNEQLTPGIQEYSSTGSAGISITVPPNSNLTGITVDGSGDLFACDSYHNYIYEIKK
jgi:sugar lactone lactonase YvrE